MFLYLGYDFVHSWDLNCEEVRRRETGFALGLGCFLKRKANRDTRGLKSLRLSRAAICLSPGLRSLECAFSVSHCLHLHCASVFISATASILFLFWSVLAVLSEISVNTASSLWSHIRQAWM